MHARQVAGLILIVTLVAFVQGQEKPPPSRSGLRPVYKNPLDVTVDDKGETASVVCVGTRTVLVVELATGKVREETPWPEGKRLPDPVPTAVHAVPYYQRIQHFVAAEFKDVTNIRAVCGTPDGKQLLFVYQRHRSELPATQVGQSWVFTNEVFLLDANGIPALVRDYLKPPPGYLRDSWRWNGKAYLLDAPQRGTADPTDVRVSKQFTWISSGGCDEVIAFSEPPVTKFESYAGPVSQIAGYDYARRRGFDPRSVLARLPTQSNPRRLALSGDGKTLVVSNFLSDSLTVIDAEMLKVVRHIPLGGPEPDAARRGEVLFNSAKLTQFGQFTCASCHPNGGADGLNWDLPRDGIGNFKNTKSLLGIKDTAPYGWLGTSATLADRVAGTLRTLHRYEPTDDEVNDLVAYLETLPAPSPPARAGLAKQELDAIERGQAIFAGKGRCADCHRGPAFDDGKLHDVGTGSFPGEDRLNTPSLRGLVATAPYLHDGKAATLEEVFSKYNLRKKHGDADRLDAQELADLIAYLRSL